MKKTILTLISSIFLFTGCSLFGPQGSLSEAEQKQVIRTTAKLSTYACLRLGVQDPIKRAELAERVADNADLTRTLFEILDNTKEWSAEGVQKILNDFTNYVNTFAVDIVGESINVSDIVFAVDVVMNLIAPNGSVLTKVGLEQWQVDLIRAFFDGVIDGAILCVVRESV